MYRMPYVRKRELFSIQFAFNNLTLPEVKIFVLVALVTPKYLNTQSPDSSKKKDTWEGWMGRKRNGLLLFILNDFPAIAFEIPLEEFDGARRPNTPPAHLQRLLQPPQPEISLPDIEEKLAEAEQRRNSVRDFSTKYLILKGVKKSR